MRIGREAVFFAMRSVSRIAASWSVVCKKRSPHEYDVTASSGNTMRDAPCASAFLHASMMRFAFAVQSATTVSGLAAAVRKNP